MKPLLILALLLIGCGSSGKQDYSIKVFAVNVDCEFAEQVTAEASQRFYAAGIPFAVTEFNCVEWPKSYELGQELAALQELTRVFGDAHFIVPRFGLYFSGVQQSTASIGTAVEGRFADSVLVASHEIAHQFGASHDANGCNIMQPRPCGDKFNDKAIEEML